MKSLLALAAATGLLAFGAPAFAQDALTPGAAGVAGSLSGSNAGTGYGYNGPLSDRINPNPAPGIDQGANNGGWAWNNGGWGGGYAQNGGWNNGGGWGGPGYGYNNGGPAYGYNNGGPGYGDNGGYGYGPQEGRAAASDY